MYHICLDAIPTGKFDIYISWEGRPKSTALSLNLKRDFRTKKKSSRVLPTLMPYDIIITRTKNRPVAFMRAPCWSIMNVDHVKRDPSSHSLSALCFGCHWANFIFSRILQVRVFNPLTIYGLLGMRSQDIFVHFKICLYCLISEDTTPCCNSHCRFQQT